MTDHFHDPYRPMSLRPQTAATVPVLPRKRLVRLGASPETIGVYEEWWRRILGERWKKESADRMAVMTDAELSEQIMAVTDLPTTSVNQALRWVRDQPHRATAASLALVVEDSREIPRPSMYDGLAKLK